MGESLLEREFETRALRRALADLAGGGGSVLALAGPAGLGKTALLRAARDQAREQGFRVLSARGAQLESAFDYGVVRQLLEPARPVVGAEHEWLFSGAGAGAAARPSPADRAHRAEYADYADHADHADKVDRADDTTDLAPAAGPAPSVSVSVSAVDGRLPGSASVLLNGLYRLVTDLAAHTPLVVIVDDMQWVDPPSARFLGFLARRVESIPITLIVGARSSRHQHDESLDEILTSADVQLLQPRSLTRSAVAELIRREFGRPGDPAFCSACHATTGGNPLFLRELLRTLAAEGVSPGAGSVAAVQAAGPAAVRRHMLVALRRRSGAARGVARAVAVLGDDTDLARVAWQCGQSLSATAAAAEQLTRDGLFDRADPPSFAHPAVRDAVLAMTARSERVVRHKPDQVVGDKHDLADHPERPGRPFPAGLDAFTSAEREVAGLAVSGLMNRQIAERLFLSEKTIESHLSRVYRKTGVRSRTQLAAHLASAGGFDHPEPFRTTRNSAAAW